MQAQELKSLVETGSYKPDLSQVATAMLQRRGVRELLALGVGAAGRIQPQATSRPRAA